MAKPLREMTSRERMLAMPAGKPVDRSSPTPMSKTMPYLRTVPSGPRSLERITEVVENFISCGVYSQGSTCDLADFKARC